MYLVDDFLLLGVLLPQAGHFPPQGLVFTATDQGAVSGPGPRSPRLKGSTDTPPPPRQVQGAGLLVTTYR